MINTTHEITSDMFNSSIDFRVSVFQSVDAHYRLDCARLYMQVVKEPDYESKSFLE